MPVPKIGALEPGLALKPYFSSAAAEKPQIRHRSVIYSMQKQMTIRSNVAKPYNPKRLIQL